MRVLTRFILAAVILVVFLVAACSSPDPATTGTLEATPVSAPVITPVITPAATPLVTDDAAPGSAPTGTSLPSPALVLDLGTEPDPGMAPVGINETNMPLTLPAGFRINLFTPLDIGPVRFMAFSPDGILFVSVPSAHGLFASRFDGSVIALPDLDQDGVADEVRPVISGLDDRPHGLAFYDGYLYLAEESKVSRYVYRGNGGLGPGEPVVENLPSSGGHVSRTVGFSPSGKMFVSIGSSCNVCVENDQRRASMMGYIPDGSEGRVYARGLRNAVGFVFHPATGDIWATENGRDNLGDDLPPDEVNIVREGQDYGWPYCYGKRVPDPRYDDSSRCAMTVGSAYDLQAHSAPLGLRFIDSPQFPREWQGDLLVAYHGSWNRSTPTGYKVVRLDVEGNEIRGVEDFIHGWLPEDGPVVGRPVDLIFGPQDGALYISDDRAGVIYRVTKIP